VRSTYVRSRLDGDFILDCEELLSRKHHPAEFGRTDSWLRLNVSKRPYASELTIPITSQKGIDKATG
jgi:hypothetical protein